MYTVGQEIMFSNWETNGQVLEGTIGQILEVIGDQGVYVVNHINGNWYDVHESEVEAIRNADLTWTLIQHPEQAPAQAPRPRPRPQPEQDGVAINWERLEGAEMRWEVPNLDIPPPPAPPRPIPAQREPVIERDGDGERTGADHYRPRDGMPVLKSFTVGVRTITPVNNGLGYVFVDQLGTRWDNSIQRTDMANYPGYGELQRDRNGVRWMTSNRYQELLLAGMRDAIIKKSGKPRKKLRRAQAIPEIKEEYHYGDKAYIA